MGYWTLGQEFLRQYRTRNRDTGAILPSSPSLARTLASQLRKGIVPRHLLEVGPGTGAVTAELLRLLREYPPEPSLGVVREAGRYGVYDLDRLERMILRRVRHLWPEVERRRVLGYGFATPYLKAFQAEAERVVQIVSAASVTMP